MPSDPSTIDWRLYVILDPRALPDDRDLCETARATLAGGAGILQLRDKESGGERLVERSRRLQEICEEHGAAFVVNDRLDVALAAGADGVHLGPGDVPVEEARRVAPELMIGGSAGTVDRAGQLVEQGVDYLGSGAVYDAEPSKPDASDPRGPEAVGRVASSVDVPVVGIGGITAENAGAVVQAGADGVAVIRAVVGRTDAERAARRLRRTVE
jgi:thiamine-phosphate diphosphorylase